MQEKNALNNFKELLGRYCAINQFIELSKRSFFSEHEIQMKERSSFIELATEHSITLTNYDADTMGTEICRSYIVNVHLCFETFLKEICEQVKRYGKREYRPRIQNESYLSCTIYNVCNDNIPRDIEPLYELCEYYRLIRNTSVHDLRNIDSHEKEFRKLQKYNFKTDAKYKKLLAPNSYENISFDDFVMFSRSCVEIATFLFEKMTYDYEKIILDIPIKQVNKWKKYSMDRLEKVLYAYIKTHYKIDATYETEKSRFVEVFLTR